MDSTEKTLAIVFNGGSYGNFVKWYINWLIGNFLPKDRPWGDNGNSHSYRRSSKLLGAMIHPGLPDNKDVKLIDTINQTTTDYSKVIFLCPTKESMIWNINNKFEKIFSDGWISHFFTYAENTVDIKKWSNDISQVKQWELREWMSIHLLIQHYKETRFDEFDTLPYYNNMLTITIDELKSNFIGVTKKLIDFLDLQVIQSTNEIENVYSEWIKLQKHHNKDQVVKNVVDSIVNNNDVVFPELTLVDESMIQRILRDEHGIHIKCFDLNQWPKTTADLKPLLYKDKNNEITLQ